MGFEPARETVSTPEGPTPFMRRLLEELWKFGLEAQPHAGCVRIFRLSLTLPEGLERSLQRYNDEVRELIDRIATASMIAERDTDSSVVFFRAVPASRTPRVCATGIDVEPSTAPFAATEHLEKATEYGGVPKLVILLDSSKLAPTYREVSASIDMDVLAKIRLTHPTMLSLEGGTKLWLSRLPASHPAVGPNDEGHYMSWIPGEAREAFLGGLILEDAPFRGAA